LPSNMAWNAAGDVAEHYRLCSISVSGYIVSFSIPLDAMALARWFGRRGAADAVAVPPVHAALRLAGGNTALGALAYARCGAGAARGALRRGGVACSAILLLAARCLHAALTYIAILDISASVIERWQNRRRRALSRRACRCRRLAPLPVPDSGDLSMNSENDCGRIAAEPFSAATAFGLSRRLHRSCG